MLGRTEFFIILLLASQTDTAHITPYANNRHSLQPATNFFGYILRQK